MAERSKWRYLIVKFSNNGDAFDVKCEDGLLTNKLTGGSERYVLENAGDDFWELVTVIPEGSNPFSPLTLYFKRPV